MPPPQAAHVQTTSKRLYHLPSFLCRAVQPPRNRWRPLPEEVLPFFLHPRYELPRRGQSCALVGFMCPAHDDNISFSGATGNRTTTLHRLIESAVVERGHHESLCVNVNCFRCLKNGDGSYVKPVRASGIPACNQAYLLARALS